MDGTRSSGPDPARLTAYEREVLSEIELWRDEKDGMLTRSLNLAGLPVGWIYKKVPDAGRRTVEHAVMGAMEILRDGSRWTYPDSGIVKEARKLGIEISDYRDLCDQDMKKLDRIARSYFGSNKVIAALEGAGCGLGGVALIAADIPVLFGVSFRAVQQIGSCYGFDMEDPDMTPVVMSVYNAGATAESAAKTAALMDMRVAATALARNWTYQKAAERTYTGVIAQLLKERTKHLPRDIANNVTKRKLAQAIPIVGAVVGAGFNYWFMSNTTRAAHMIFRDMYLTRKYADDHEL